MMSINLNDIVNLNIRGVNYRHNIKGISKTDTENLLQNADLTEENYQKNYKNFKFFLQYIKWVKKFLAIWKLKNTNFINAKPYFDW